MKKYTLVLMLALSSAFSYAQNQSKNDTVSIEQQWEYNTIYFHNSHSNAKMGEINFKNHGINGREINHLAIAFGFARSEFIGFFKLCVQFRTSLFNIGLIEIEYVIDLKFRIHCYVLLLLIGHLLVIIVLNLLMARLLFSMILVRLGAYFPAVAYPALSSPCAQPL